MGSDSIYYCHYSYLLNKKADFDFYLDVEKFRRGYRGSKHCVERVNNNPVVCGCKGTINF